MRKLRYISLFSGIEAVSCALDHDLWEPIAFSEIDSFPSAVLAQHYPSVPNLGDITKIDWSPYVGSIDVVWGGSPCQSFSIAGKREGLAGESGLMFEYIRAVQELRPKFFVWENVPGALSSENGNAFRQLLSEMDEIGYGLSWRVLDAQFFGVAQRRERVFLVGSLGDMRCAEVLFEREGLPWDYSSSREKRKTLTGRIETSIGAADSIDGGCLTPWDCQSKRIYSQNSVWPTLYAAPKGGSINQAVVLNGDSLKKSNKKVYLCETANTNSNGLGIKLDDVMNTLDTHATTAVAVDFHQQDGRFQVSKNPDLSATITAHAGTGGNNVPMVMCRASQQANATTLEECSPTLTSAAGTSGNNTPIVFPKTMLVRCGKPGGGKGALIQDDMSATLSTSNVQTLFAPITMMDATSNAAIGYDQCGTLTSHAAKFAPIVASPYLVRRLTPVECERLQGFPDGWTDVPFNGKEHPSDSLRYKALGNSMAVPVMRWIGERVYACFLSLVC